MFLGYHCSKEQVLRYECLVGGLPFKRSWPFEYKAPFSPIDVIEEYTRPARLVSGGKIIERPALSEREYVDFDRVGTLEAFNTDGLRTLLKTVKVPDMVEKTLRYPGHADYMLMLRETGFFSENPIEVDGKVIRPIDLTTRLLFPSWKLEENEPEFTAMQLSIDVIDEEKPTRHIYRLFDQYDEKSGVSSMARTTGYTCTSAVRALAKGAIERKGIIAPEYLGMEPRAFDIIRIELEKRGVHVEHIEEFNLDLSI
jgi:saccharopine dehydrogenase-like NADP-dependent oxidoreductase